MAGLLGRARRAAAGGGGGLPRDRIAVPGQPDHASRAPRPSGWPASSTSSCWCSSPARGSTRPRWPGPSTWCEEDLRPSEVLNAEVVRAARGRTVRPNTAGPEALHRRHRHQHHHLRHRPGRDRQVATWRWPWPSRRSRPARSTGSSSTRPAVEAGERLGFLPGDLMAKVDPYLRPLYDALYDLLEPEGAQRLLGTGHHRGRPAGLHAGPDPQPLVHHLRRGPEHHARADEDVPHPDRLRLQVRGHRRRHPDRRGRRALGAGRASSRSSARSTASPSCTSPGATSSATRSWPTSSTPTRRPSARPPRSPAPMAADVFAADEQADLAVDLARCGAGPLGARGRGVKGDAEVSLLFVDEAAIAALNERFLGQRRARPTCWPSPSRTSRVPGGRSPDQGGTGPGVRPTADEPPAPPGRRRDLPGRGAPATPPSTG